jgi:putative transcriptional regulator
MSSHVDDLIPELVLGTLDTPTRETVEGHLERCERCSAEVAAMGEALSLVALSLPPEEPHPGLRTNLLAAIAEDRRREASPKEGRLAGFVDQLARFFDVTTQRARTLLDLIDDPSAWTRGPARGIALIHVLAGPRLANTDAGFIRMAPGARFPHHRHIGDEYGLILEGGIMERDGAVARAGEFHNRNAGTSHDFVALPGEGCLFAAVVHEGIEFVDD